MHAEKQSVSLIRFGLAPYFEKEVLDMIIKPENLFVMSFDESFENSISVGQITCLKYSLGMHSYTNSIHT